MITKKALGFCPAIQDSFSDLEKCFDLPNKQADKVKFSK
ncbi:hypothetical protein STRPS_2030 [Streptococcus pseudoporcinus LQ 940-04]|uniref:Uncharacterized protein n=1 Tax=Streptococcus pseudoporcinus LQ 940-04 TaxID=875093 RepID=G5KAR7_9STRE|nr:hypothetical protein HMPREF9320_0670 [Streptococcus pseudoporcinus SPIN 20026]EHI64426.1 hypothetical protein STRPS_2030 [Streptococcus pseudoporcinus LQ 940-04]